MTEPDEATLWARNDWAKALDEFKPFAAARIRRGGDDGHLTEYVRAYRAGQAASAERIKALEEEVARLKERALPAQAPATTPGPWRADQ
jgi:hypothetical protein